MVNSRTQVKVGHIPPIFPFRCGVLALQTRDLGFRRSPHGSPKNLIFNAKSVKCRTDGQLQPSPVKYHAAAVLALEL